MQPDPTLGASHGSVQVVLRTHRSGDIGWIIQRHGEIYAHEYGWDTSFEAVVAEVCANFLRRYDPARERCWIAEVDGRRVGSVMLIQDREHADAARLRVLLVEPDARGLGVGRMLVEECTRFARTSGYLRILLWTNSLLAAARKLYEREGYHLVETRPHNVYGHNMTGETWELIL